MTAPGAPAGQDRARDGSQPHRRDLPGPEGPARARTSCADLLFLRGHRARVARLPVGEPEGLMPNLLST